MRPACCAAFGFSIMMGAILSSAQPAPLPLAPGVQDSHATASESSPLAALAVEPLPVFSLAGSPVSAAAALPSAAASMSGFRRAPAASAPATLNARYLWLNGLHLSLAVADITMTQHCIDAHTCREGNPLMPSSEAGKYGLSVGIAAYTAATSYWFKKHRSRIWWAGPTVGIAAHTVGLASGWMHR